MPDDIGINGDPPKLLTKIINCLLYADDLVILSLSAEGLQKSIDNLFTYCTKWGLTANIEKTKVLVFNPQGRKQNININYGNDKLQCVTEYKYLGITFMTSGNFQLAQDNLYKKGLKAYFKLSKTIYRHSEYKTVNNSSPI